MTLRILQWNAQSIRRKQHELASIVETAKPHIILLNETHLTDNEKINIPDFVPYYLNRITPHPRPSTQL